MINRLILNLAQGADQRENSDFRTRTGFEAPAFAAGSFLGNIGGPVRTFPDNYGDEFEDDGSADSGGHDTAVKSSTNGAEEICNSDFGRRAEEGSVWDTEVCAVLEG